MAASVSTKTAVWHVIQQPPNSSSAATTTNSKVKKIVVDFKRGNINKSNQLSNGVADSKKIDKLDFKKVEVVAFDPSVDYEKLIKEEKLKATLHKKLPVVKPPLSQTFQGSLAVQRLIKSCEEYANKVLADSLLKNQPQQSRPAKSMKFTLSDSIHKPSTFSSVIFRVPRSTRCTKAAYNPLKTSPLPENNIKQPAKTKQLTPLPSTSSTSSSLLQKSNQTIQTIDQTKARQPVSTTGSSSNIKSAGRPTLIFIQPTIITPVLKPKNNVSQQTPSLDLQNPVTNPASNTAVVKEEDDDNDSGVQSSSPSTTDSQEPANRGKRPFNSIDTEKHTSKKASYGCLWGNCSYQSHASIHVQNHIRKKHFNVPLTQKEQENKNIYDPQPVTRYIKEF